MIALVVGLLALAVTNDVDEGGRVDVGVGVDVVLDARQRSSCV